MKTLKIESRLIFVTNYAGWKNICIAGEFSALKKGDKFNLNRNDFPLQFEILKQQIAKTSNEPVVKEIIYTISENCIDTIVEIFCEPHRKSILDLLTLRI